MTDPLPSKPPQIAESVAAIADAHAEIRSEAEQHAQSAARSREDLLSELDHALEAPEA